MSRPGGYEAGGRPEDAKPPSGPPAGAMPEGLTKMQAGAAGLHEVVCSFEDAGFTRAEALYLLAVNITKRPGEPPENRVDRPRRS